MNEQQARRALLNAVNASTPIGMGILQFEDKLYTLMDLPEVHIDPKGAQVIYLDYFHGRMVKTGILKETDKDTWEIQISGAEIHPEYQSWASTYPSFEALVESAQ